MKNNLFTGVSFFFQGLKLVLSPRLRRYIIVPVIINLILLIALIYFLAHKFSDYFGSFILSYPHWLMVILGWFFWLIFWASSLLLSALIFTLLTNIIASPFYALLAEETEKRLTPLIVFPTLPLWRTIPHILFRELRKILYFIPWFIGCLILSLIPFTLPIAPVVWWVVLSWVLSIQYIDYAADNRHFPLKQMITLLKKVPFTILGFGGAVTFLMTIPGANLIVPPAAVAGGTALWLYLRKGDSNEQHHIDSRI